MSRDSPRENPEYLLQAPNAPRAQRVRTSGSLLRNILGTCHVFPSAEQETSPPGYFPSRHVSPNAPSGESLRMPPELATRPECLNEHLPEAAECATCPARIFPRMPPVAPRVPSRETTRVPPGSPANHPGRPPGALSECATCPGSLFLLHLIPEKSNKMFGTSKIHRNSSFN